MGATKIIDRDHGYKSLMRAASGSRQGRRLRVGVDGDDEMQLVASVQEFGSETVPSRSFIRAWFDDNRARIAEDLRNVAKQSITTGVSRDELMAALGRLYRDEIQERILHGLNPALKEQTIKHKLEHGDPATPLVTSAGNLISSIVAMLDEQIV